MTSRSNFDKMNSTLGSVVPLAMFAYLIGPKSNHCIVYTCLVNLTDVTLAVEDLNSILDNNDEADDVADAADEGKNHNLNSN